MKRDLFISMICLLNPVLAFSQEEKKAIPISNPMPVLNIVSYYFVMQQNEFSPVENELFGAIPTPLVISSLSTPYVARDITGQKITKVEIVTEQEKKQSEQAREQRRHGRK